MQKLSDFDYILPKELIANEPTKPRDRSRLLVLRSEKSQNSEHAKSFIEHKHFYDLPLYLRNGDILVLNNSKVFPARLIGKKIPNKGKIEVFLLKPLDDSAWNCLIGGRGPAPGLEAEFGKGLRCKLIKDNNDGTWQVGFNLAGKEMLEIVEKVGEVPLPPYIKKNTRNEPSEGGQKDKQDYQTVYADDEKAGSAAAPTAGLHFTPGLLEKLIKKGVIVEYVTLHVGLGTFAPVKTDDITMHKMHSEYVEISKQAFKNIIRAKREKRRIIAVGTTSVRALESVIGELLVGDLENKELSGKNEFLNREYHDFSGFINIFIYPDYKFKVVDGIVTNFHLPKSTLFMLVCALAGKERIKTAYKEAIRERYRFYSYGDAMLII